MALTYLATSMIETPTVFPQLSVTSLNVNTITSSPSVLGDLTIYGSLTALSGFNVVIASTTSTSALSVSNIQMTPALEVYQGPAGQVIAVFKNQAGDVVTVKDTGLTVSGIVSTSNAGSSNLWHSVYTTTLANSANWSNVYTNVVSNSSVFTNVQSNSSVFTNVQSNSSVFTNVQSNSANWNNVFTNVQSNSANWTNAYTNVQSNSANWQSTYLTVSALSASWEESADILPTVTNHLSTNNVLVSGLTVINNISASGNIFAQNLTQYMFLTADEPLTNLLQPTVTDPISAFFLFQRTTTLPLSGSYKVEYDIFFTKTISAGPVVFSLSSNNNFAVRGATILYTSNTNDLTASGITGNTGSTGIVNGISTTLATFPMIPSPTAAIQKDNTINAKLKGIISTFGNPCTLVLGVSTHPLSGGFIPRGGSSREITRIS